MENQDKVLAVLLENGSPMKSAEIADKAGIEKKEVEKLIKKLKVEEKIFSPKRCFYDVKE